MPHREMQARIDPVFGGANFFTGPEERKLTRIRRGGDEFLVVTGGVYKATYDDPRGKQIHIRAQAGDVVLWPVGANETDESEEGHPLRCIQIFLQWPHRPAWLPIMVHDAGHLLDMLAQRLLMLSHDPTRPTARKNEANAYLAAMAAEFVDLARKYSDDLVAKVMRYTEEHIHQRIRLSDLARHVGLNKTHLGRKYKKATSRTPMQDVLCQKAALARLLLMGSPKITLKDVAQRVGLPDGAKVSRLLKQYAGASARDLKKMARNTSAKRQKADA
jgi:AraC-like DNA-binding protein